MNHRFCFSTVFMWNWILRANYPTCKSTFGTQLVCKLRLCIFKISRILYCKIPKTVTKQECPKYILRRITEVTSLHKGLSNWQWWQQGIFWVQGGFLQFSEFLLHVRPWNCIWFHATWWGHWNQLLVSILTVGKTEVPERKIRWLVHRPRACMSWRSHQIPAP